jgi:hypothetical protein
MGGRSSRRKGHDFERWVARTLREFLQDDSIHRGFQTRGGGAEEPDVVLEGYHIECKVGKLPGIRAAYRQALRDAKENTIPLAIIRDDRQQPFVVIAFEHFLPMLAATTKRDTKADDRSLTDCANTDG